MLVGQTDLITDQLPNNMYLDNFRNEKEEITRVPTASADRMNVDRRGSRGDSLNKPAQLERIKMKALEYMSKLEAAPGETTPTLQLWCTQLCRVVSCNCSRNTSDTSILIQVSPTSLRFAVILSISMLVQRSAADVSITMRVIYRHSTCM